jgi:hypothetical protein
VSQLASEITGLDHAFDCHDWLSQLSDCGPRSFLDANVNCGDFSARACQCGGTTQNSHQTMMATLCP